MDVDRCQGRRRKRYATNRKTFLLACRLFCQICYHVFFHIASNNDSSFNEKFYEDEYEFIWLNIHSVLYYDEFGERYYEINS